MKKEYDFSYAERGNFYHSEVKANTPINRQIKQDISEIMAFSNHSANTINEWLDDKEDDIWVSKN